MTQQENIQLKADGFFFFSKVFYEDPTLEFVNSVIDSAKEGVWSFPFTTKVAENAFKKLSKQDYNSKEKEIDLIADYTRLFIGPDKTPATPYASIYIDKKEELFTEETIKVEKFYKKCGMAFKDANRLPSDHVGLEFIFLGFLYSQYATYINDSVKHKKELDFIRENITFFLDNHLLPWVKKFLKATKENADTEYYKQLAVLALDFIKYIEKETI